MIKIKTATAIIVIAIIINGCTNKKQTSEPNAIPVKIQLMEPASTGTEHNYVGVIEESFATTLSFETSGNVQHVYIKEGDRVSKGQLIADLNETTAQNAYNVAKATFDKAQDGYTRSEQLYKNRSLSELKWVEVQTAFTEAKSLAEIAKKNLQDCKMYAPISGVISSLDIEQGMNVIPYESVAKLVDISELCVKVSIPENEIADISIGQNVQVIVSALNNASFTGKITEKGIKADILSNCYDIKVKLNNPEKNLLPGMVCKALIQYSDTSESKIQVPVNAVQITNEGQRYVWVAKNKRSQRCFVTIGELTNKNVIIQSGLKQGDTVIVEGYQKVSEGSLLKY